MKNFNKMTLVAAAVVGTLATGAVTAQAALNGEQNVVKKAQKEQGTRYIIKFHNTSEQSLMAAGVEGKTFFEMQKNANASLMAKHGAEMLVHLDYSNAAAAVLSRKQLAALKNDPNVDYVEVDPRRHLIDTVSRSFPQANAVEPMAESTPYGITMVQANQVSDANTGNRSVCIMDTGYDGDHEDLVQHTSSLITGDNDAGGGNNTGNWWEPGHGHGTHVAGTIAAVGGNGKGVVGVNPSGLLKVHNVKVFNNAGTWGYGSDLVKAIEQCRAAGSDVISMSLGGSASSTTESNAFQAALDAGVLNIAAAGNGGNTSMSYPASYDSVMSVAAINSSKNLASFSQRNSQVEIAAPGVAVNSTNLNNQYASWDGTSMATPHVSGVAALVWSHYTHCSATQIRNALNMTAEDLGSAGRDNSYGYGLVQAKAMYDALAQSCDVGTPPPPPPPVGGVLENGVARTGLAAGTGEELNFTMEVPAGATGISFTMSGGTGDADLYTKFGSAPTTSSYDCRPYASGNNETCTGTAAGGTYHVMVRGYSTFSGVTLVGNYTDGGTPPPGGDSFTNNNNVDIVDRGTVESDIAVSGSGDAGNITVDVDIKHTYVGDLTLTLVSPSGATAVLRQNTGGSADNIQESYNVNATGQARNGTWKLRVNDNARYDTGYIDSWTINF